MRPKELVFLHSSDSIIEKQIGKKEEVGLQVLKQNIVGFSDGIRFSASSFDPSNYVRVQGYGMIYLETLSQAMRSAEPGMDEAELMQAFQRFISS